MEFSNQIIEIEHPIYLYRYSLPDGTSPHQMKKWELEKQSVVSLNELGIFGILLDDVVTNDTKNYYDWRFGDNENVLILLESSRKYIVLNQSEPNLEKKFCRITNAPFLNLAKVGVPVTGCFETSVSRANIIGTVQNGEFGKILKLAMDNNTSKGRGVFAGLENIKEKCSPKYRIKTIEDEWNELVTKVLLGIFR